MTLTDRLERLRDNRDTLIARLAERREKKRNGKDVERDLVRVTAKVLKFERKAEKAK